MKYGYISSWNRLDDMLEQRTRGPFGMQKFHYIFTRNNSFSIKFEGKSYVPNRSKPYNRAKPAKGEIDINGSSVLKGSMQRIY